jgi:hypothetical protein
MLVWLAGINNSTNSTAINICAPWPPFHLHAATLRRQYLPMVCTDNFIIILIIIVAMAIAVLMRDRTDHHFLLLFSL